ncbi:hypothetical protein [Uliginosibacterium sp. TH139]|uniref:hypothetical protein n=1 Tax=Uliginosibacterium sp. TH139 TaxID=2067453 RepID=UPI000C7B30D1|nr:hypothetical protein [Uliginosibacterium sp. TH139]PLK46974.1 hypothetical protein C0V76_19140 [Uliginosibacterium sp. TH139]
MSEQSPSPALQHLFPPQVDTLIERYYAGENINSLMAEYDLTCSPAQLFRAFPPEQLGTACPACGEAMIKSRLSRSSSKYQATRAAQCSICAHRDTPGCRCVHCTALRKQLAKEKPERDRAAIANFCQNNWSYEPKVVEPEELSSDAAVALLSLIRSGGWLNESCIGAIKSACIPFVPKEFTVAQHLLSTLLSDGLIAPAPSSPSGAFVLSDSEVIAWDWQIAQWQLLIPEAPDFVRRLEILIADDSWHNDRTEPLRALWKRLAVSECWEYCAYSVAQRSLPMPGTTALTTLFDNLLRDHSVSQCYQLIWNAAGRAVDFMVRSRVSPKHAANAIIGNCQRYADHARAEGWNIRGFHRNFDLPRSQLSHVLHDVVFKHGGVGFRGVIPTFPADALLQG